MSGAEDPRVLPAVLGWANPDTRQENVRLYALDAGPSPRWAADGGRTVERAILERDGTYFEGDRYMVVHLGSRFVDKELVERVHAAVVAALGDE